MNLFEVFRQALDSIRANKLRSSLTLLAIAVGVFAVIGSNTAVLVLDTYFKNTLTLMGGNVITVQKRPGVSMGNDWMKYRNRRDITFAHMEELSERADMVRNVGPYETFSVDKVTFESNSTEPNVSIRGANEFFLDNNAFDLEAGRNFTEQDIRNARNMAIIGFDVVDVLFEGVDPVGKTIRIKGMPFTVIGVTETKGATFGQSQDRFVLAPYTALLNLYGGNRDISIQVAARSIDRIEDTIDELIGVMRLVRKVEPGEPNDFEIVTNESLGGVFDQFTGVLYIIGFVVGGISLLGAGIGVMNIMLVSVTERTREIGIRKAVGATKKAIVSQFLMEAIAICQIGGVVGILTGAAVGNLMTLWLDTSLVFPWMAAILGVVGMTAVGLLFGVYPAFKASELDPIESLRYE